MEQLDIGMIFGIGEHSRDHAALLGDAQAALGAQGFEIDGLMQSGPHLKVKSPRHYGSGEAILQPCSGFQAAVALRRPRFWPGLRPRPICLASSRRFSA